MKKKIAILTGGGDVPPLNALIASAAETARAAGAELIGFIKGWQGVLEEKFVELTEFPLNPEIGGTVLKSSRIGLRGALARGLYTRASTAEVDPEQSPGHPPAMKVRG